MYAGRGVSWYDPTDTRFRGDIRNCCQSVVACMLIHEKSKTSWSTTSTITSMSHSWLANQKCICPGWVFWMLPAPTYVIDLAPNPCQVTTMAFASLYGYQRAAHGRSDKNGPLIMYPERSDALVDNICFAVAPYGDTKYSQGVSLSFGVENI
jgi:hypothetical protein